MVHQYKPSSNTQPDLTVDPYSRNFCHPFGQHSGRSLSIRDEILKFYFALMGVKMGNIIGKRGSWMPFETCKRRILRSFEPYLSSGILGAWGLVMSYFIVVVLLREIIRGMNLSISVLSVVF